MAELIKKLILKRKKGLKKGVMWYTMESSGKKVVKSGAKRGSL